MLLLAMLIISQTACTGQSGGKQAQTSFSEDWLLNTYCYIQTFEGGQEDLIRKAFSLAREYENLLSRTVASSDIGRFNASQGGCAVQEDTAKLLEDCREAWELSDHMLDATMGAVTSLWDFSAEDPKVPDAAAIAERLQYVGAWDRLYVSPREGDPDGLWEAHKGDEGIMLDLGAVAKGYIADKTAEYLRSEGVAQAIVNFGGNVVFVGSKYQEGGYWSCGIEDPAAGGSEELIQERDIVGTVHVSCKPDSSMSVVTSGTYERCFVSDGVTYHHVLDPRTGYPMETDLLSATVIGPSSELCDILSTTCLLLGSERGMALIDSQEGYEAVFILQDGSIIKTDGADFTAKQ